MYLFNLVVFAKLSVDIHQTFTYLLHLSTDYLLPKYKLSEMFILLADTKET